MQRIDIKLIKPNTGQIEGVPANPRQWKKGEVEKLARSIEQTPELFDLRPIIVYDNVDGYVAIGGNMRLAAAKHLKWKDVPCEIVSRETSTGKLKEIVIKDNGSFGEWDFDALANEWDDLDLGEWGVPVNSEWSKELPNFGEKNKEIDVDEFGDKVEIKFSFETEEWQFVNNELQNIDANKELALLKLLNYQANE